MSRPSPTIAAMLAMAALMPPMKPERLYRSRLFPDDRILKVETDEEIAHCAGNGLWETLMADPRVAKKVSPPGQVVGLHGMEIVNLDRDTVARRRVFGAIETKLGVRL